jgi:hypothetical protein
MGCTCSKDAVNTACTLVLGKKQRLPDSKDEIDQVVKQVSVAKWAKVSGFRPEHAVAIFPSLSGVQLERIESSLKPSWKGSALWVELSMITTQVVKTHGKWQFQGLHQKRSSLVEQVNDVGGRYR